jgi:CRISPR system Cascade subunit CasA
MSAHNRVRFNLVEEKWIPVRTLEGELRLVSLKEALIHAREFAGLSEELAPPSLIGLYRLLLAALHRALTWGSGGWTNRDKIEWFTAGIPRQWLEGYLDQWRDRFWLFHPEYPFLQVPVLTQAESTKNKSKPWTQIALERACGNNPTLFDHSLDADPEPAPWGRVLWSLVGFLQFTPGGLVRALRQSDKEGPLANSAAVLPLGGTLAETLLLALHPSTSPGTEDIPSWEQNPPTVEELARGQEDLATGPNDRYTRLTRAVLLIEEEPGAGSVRWIRFGAGRALAKDPQRPDPMVATRMDPSDAKPVRFEEGRAFWRDLPTLVPAPADSMVHPPAVLSWATALCAALGQLDREMPILVAGVASQQAKLLRWRKEVVRLPAKVLTAQDAAHFVRLWVGRCEEVYNDLRSSLSRVQEQLAKSGAAPRSRRAGFRSDMAAAVYFQRAEWALPELLSDAVNNRTAEKWRRELWQAAREAWDTGIRHLGASATVWVAEARQRASFFARCREKLNMDAEE